MSEQTEKNGNLAKSLKASFMEDKLLYILAILLLVTLGLASLYGFKYGNVDESVVPGSVTMLENGEVALDLTVDEDMNATVNTIGFKMTGKLKLAGAETDSILYQLRNVELLSDSRATEVEDTSEPILFIRMPRSGLQGDFTGPWMVYFTKAGVKYSKWAFVNADGTATLGFRNSVNGITEQRKVILSWSDPQPWSWKLSGTTLSLTSPQAG